MPASAPSPSLLRFEIWHFEQLAPASSVIVKMSPSYPQVRSFAGRGETRCLQFLEDWFFLIVAFMSSSWVCCCLLWAGSKCPCIISLTRRLLGVRLPRFIPQVHCLSPKWSCTNYLMHQVLIICYRQMPRTMVGHDLWLTEVWWSSQRSS